MSRYNLDQVDLCLRELSQRCPSDICHRICVTPMPKLDRDGYCEGVYYGVGLPLFEVRWTDKHVTADLSGSYVARAISSSTLLMGLMRLYPNAFIFVASKSKKVKTS